MSPPSDQVGPEGWFPFLRLPPWYLPQGGRQLRRLLGGAEPTPCTYLHTLDTPHLDLQTGLWAAPQVIWSTPLSLTKTSCQGAP